MGVRPPQSQLIRICVPQKSCFLATFFGKILVLTHFDTTYPPPMIYIVGKLWISRFMSSRPHTPEFNLYAVRFFVTLRESSHHRTSHSVVCNYGCFQNATYSNKICEKTRYSNMNFWCFLFTPALYLGLKRGFPGLFRSWCG